MKIRMSVYKVIRKNGKNEVAISMCNRTKNIINEMLDEVREILESEDPECEDLHSFEN